jgi:hypothetical protein
MNGLDGWTCSIFRHTGGGVASTLILEAERELMAINRPPGPSGMLTYVWDAKIKSRNPGYCFKRAGWRTPPLEIARPRSADGKKSLLWKPWIEAGIAP